MRRILGVLLVAGPFVAGLIAAASARRDLRLIAMAVVATIAAWVLRPKTRATAARIALTLVVATAVAAAPAVLAGARGVFGVVAVAVVMAAFATAGAVLLSPISISARREPSLHAR